MQNNLPNIYRIALRIDDVHEVQTIAAPGAEAERIALLVDVGLEHLLPERVFDAQLVAVHKGEVAVIDGEGAAGRVGEYLDGIGIGRRCQLGNERVDDERIGNSGEHGIVNGNYILNGNGIVNGEGAGIERVDLLYFFGAQSAVPDADVVERTVKVIWKPTWSLILKTVDSKINRIIGCLLLMPVDHLYIHDKIPVPQQQRDAIRQYQGKDNSIFRHMKPQDALYRDF